ncbi:MAG: helix-turn-helix transcriptional regulator [Clostridia bacterium]|nr:helix-turn-helix transcriptional regulator [Clostridia bacterium]
MTNTNLLLGLVRASGLTCKDVADKAKMSPNTFSIKANNGREFTAGEISKIAKVLNLTMDDVEAIFFADDVE